jgi:hypothetical protein
MYKEILQNINHVEIWPIISFVIFFLFFILISIWAFTVDKKFIRYMKELPLGKEPERETNSSVSEETLITKNISQ